MLRRYATVAFAVLGLLVLDWEDPSAEGPLVLDAFDGIAEIIDTLENDAASKNRDAKDPQIQTEWLMGSSVVPALFQMRFKNCESRLGLTAGAYSMLNAS